MADPARTIDTLYRSFAALDVEGMAACYADEVRFQDEVFSLEGRRATVGMWAMLCHSVKARSADVWKLEFDEVRAQGTEGSARWRVTYRFGPKRRVVENDIRASFRFDERGLIAQHRDRFDFWRWSGMALGPTGLLLGWTPLVRGKVRAQAARSLEKFLAGNGG